MHSCCCCWCPDSYMHISYLLLLDPKREEASHSQLMELDLQHWSHALKIRLILLSLSYPCILYFFFLIPYKATLCGIHAAKSLMPSDRVMGSRKGLSLWFDSIMNFNMLHNQSPLLWSKAILSQKFLLMGLAVLTHTHISLSLSEYF